MPRAALMRSLLVLGCALLAPLASGNDARTTTCDDNLPKPEGIECAHVPPFDAACPQTDQVMALLHGCYFCVDKQTCLLAGVLPASTGAASETPTPTRSATHSSTHTPAYGTTQSPGHSATHQPTHSPTQTAQSPTQDPTPSSTRVTTPIPTVVTSHKAAKSGVAKATASNSVRGPVAGAGLAVASQGSSDSAGGFSNWSVVAPVGVLALVGAAVAARRLSKPSPGREFERLQEDPTDEINPFCSSVAAHDSDDGDLELVDRARKHESVEEEEEDEEDEEDCDDDGPDIVVLRPVLDGTDEDDGEEECL